MSDPLQGLPGLVADIRAAVGDPDGKLMQDELIARCRDLHKASKDLRITKGYLLHLVQSNDVIDAAQEEVRLFLRGLDEPPFPS